jgi:hypothetical protein
MLTESIETRGVRPSYIEGRKQDSGENSIIRKFTICSNLFGKSNQEDEVGGGHSTHYNMNGHPLDHLCGLLVRVPGC